MRAPLPSSEEARLRDFCRASGDWMWETDEQLRYTWVSDEISAVTGLMPSGLVGRPVEDAVLVHLDGSRARRGNLLQLLARRQAFSGAVSEKRTPRGLLYVSRSAVPVFDGSGRFLGYRGTARDITAQVESARRSRQHEDLLERLSSHVPGVIFQLRIERNGRFHFPYMSDGLPQVLRLEGRREFDARRSARLYRQIHRDDRRAVVDSLARAYLELTPWQCECRVIAGDTVAWIEVRAMPEQESDGSTLWHGFIADVSERKEIELALRRSEERWDMAADAAGIGIAEVDLATGLMSMDRRACANHGLGYPLVGYTLQDWLQAVDASEREQARHELFSALHDRRTVETRYRLRRPDGTDVVLEVGARGLYDRQGQPVGLVGTCRDVTSQWEFERLQRDKQAAERANDAKSEFLSRVSHELRTPLNAILGFTQLMLLDRAEPLSPAQRKRLDNARRAGRHLLGLINDMLELTRIEQEDFTVQPIGVDAWSAVADCLALVQPLADEAEVALPSLPVACEPVWAVADPRALEQVLMNLLSNAIKYNRRGGRVTLEIRRDARHGTVRIAVRDQGPGLDEQQQAQLFQPFNRLGAERTRVEGSGLGLVISRRLLAAIGGQLHVESRPGGGSTFVIELPAAEGAEAASADATVAPAASFDSTSWPSHRVLYVEDEPLNMILMEDVFRQLPGWTLLMASNGAEGERLAREMAPELVLIDMNLGDIDGIELLRRLSRHPDTCELRCIAVSADAMREQVEEARAAGFLDYWTKPIDVPRVLDALVRLLSPRTTTDGKAQAGGAL
ncbi:ATP-binding protein [Schlegelella sp. S2-27]|uniref:histidine kinase n=1 Tax=Caldimonas mangrovi TaxID=2944811 RepID=A0ABT0YMT9_9BURK|nr:ATP-binding protein [Caldimonas mangrovi]MCM5680049.1 ATP-binding protein [Caldimonas mangrovi]